MFQEERSLINFKTDKYGYSIYGSLLLRQLEKLKATDQKENLEEGYTITSWTKRTAKMLSG